MKRLLVVDDHQIIRDGLRFYFEEDTDFIIAGEAENGKEALKLMEKETFDVVLTDINMPEMDGIELMENINKIYINQKVIVLSTFNEYPYINKMIARGANGYILKKSSKTELVAAINNVLNGETHFSAEVTTTIINSIAKTQPKTRLTLETPLSKREMEILKLIAGELSNQEIADKLFISIRTVDTHKRNIIEKTGCKNVAGLVMYAIERNLV